MHSQVLKLYSNVIDDFIVLLEKQYKHKDNITPRVLTLENQIFVNSRNQRRLEEIIETSMEQKGEIQTLITPEVIDKIKKSLKSKIKDPSHYHKYIIEKFYYQCNEAALIPQVKNQPQPIFKQQKPHQQDNPPLPISNNRVKSLQQDQDDDLNQFKKNENSALQKNELKKQQDFSANNLNNLYEFDSDDDDEKLNIQELQSIKERTGVHILGTYHTKEKKFNSKREETKLTVYNAFVKIDGHDHELLFPVVDIVAKRVGKSSIHI